MGTVDLVNGKTDYNLAKYTRKNECGQEGIYFEKNNYKIITVPYYFVKENSYLIFLSMFTILYWMYLIK